MPEENKEAQQAAREKAAQIARQRQPRKPLLDTTNLLGALVWILSAMLTAIALAGIFVAVPAQCLGARGQVVPSCLWPLVISTEGLQIVGASFILQLIISATINRIPHPVVKGIGKSVEVLINIVGIYWILCVQFGISSAQGLRVSVSTVMQNTTVATIIWTLIIMTLAWGMQHLSDALFAAPPKSFNVRK